MDLATQKCQYAASHQYHIAALWTICAVHVQWCRLVNNKQTKKDRTTSCEYIQLCSAQMDKTTFYAQNRSKHLLAAASMFSKKKHVVLASNGKQLIRIKLSEENKHICFSESHLYLLLTQRQIVLFGNRQPATYFCKLIISFSAQIFMILRGFCFLNSSLKKRTSPRTYCQRLRNSANVVLNTLSTHSAGTTAFCRLQHQQVCMC